MVIRSTWGRGMTVDADGFLAHVQEPSPRTWRGTEREERGRYWTGPGSDGLEVAHTRSDTKPSVTEVRKLWAERHRKRAAPLLLVAEHPGGALLCGPLGENPPVVERDVAQAERLAAAALAEPTRHFASQFLVRAMDADPDDIPGLHNRGLLASHELRVGVPQRSDWAEAVEHAQPLLRLLGRDLVERLGFTVEDRPKHSVLRVGVNGNARVVAVFLNESEQPDLPSDRYDRQTPVTYALTQAERDGLPYVLAVRSSMLRLYSTTTSGAVGQRGRTETYVGLDLPMLSSEHAGYLPLLFSAEALAEGGTFEAIAEASSNFAADLSTRLRERVYTQVVPQLARAIANRVGAATETKQDLDEHYRVAVTVLFRLLFIAYAEDSRLLPLNVNDDYTRHALKTVAREQAAAINAGHNLGFNNPLTDVVEPDTDTTSTDLWDTCRNLFIAVDQGRASWGVPVYNGGLFASNGEANPVGPVIEGLRLTNAEVGPALVALLVDETADGIVGPIDFRSLSVREFGTIYEGLLESELARTDVDLTLTRDNRHGDVYAPAGDGDTVIVEAGGVYLHNKSGARKASGSYFTKPFAVQHLIESAVMPTLDEHLERVAVKLDEGDEVGASELLFDFRVADIAMGSGHFLTAVVDALEARYATFLAEHPISHVTVMLETLRQAAHANLGVLADTADIETAALLRRLIARRCVYGVDINPISVELARVSMWIHTFVPGLPLSFLDHNLIVGDSLTGIGTVDEAMDELTETGAQAGLFDDPVRDTLAAAEEPLKRLSGSVDATTSDIHAARLAAGEARLAVQPVTDLFNLLVAHRLGKVAKPTITSLDDLPEGDVAIARDVASGLSDVHFPVAFPEVFIRERPGFDAVIGNPPWEEARSEKREFWALRFPGLRSSSQAEQAREIALLEAGHPQLAEEYERERAKMDEVATLLYSGPYPGMGTGDPDLYKAFAWRFWKLVRGDGRAGVVLPRSALAATGLTEWREEVLGTGEFEDVTVLLNNRGWVFDDVEHRYTVGLIVLRRAKSSEGAVRMSGPYASQAEYVQGRERSPAEVPAEDFRSWTPNAVFPLLPTEMSVPVFAKMRRHRRFSDLPFRPVVELHATSDKKHMVLDDDEHRHLWPVYGGSAFNLWQPDTGERFAWVDGELLTNLLHEKRKRQARTRSSAFFSMPQDLLDDPKSLPVMHPRVAFRGITNRTNRRSLIAALVPPHCALTNAAPYLLRLNNADVRDEAFVLGLLSSVPVDWQVRRTVEVNLNFHVLGPVGLPWPDRNHNGYRRVVAIAGQLAAVDDRYMDWAATVGVPVGSVTSDEEHDNLVAELDACVSRLYGLGEAELTHVFETFHVGWDFQPRLDRVLEHFRALDFDPAPTSEVLA